MTDAAFFCNSHAHTGEDRRREIITRLQDQLPLPEWPLLDELAETEAIANAVQAERMRVLDIVRRSVHTSHFLRIKAKILL